MFMLKSLAKNRYFSSQNKQKQLCTLVGVLEKIKGGFLIYYKLKKQEGKIGSKTEERKMKHLLQ